MNTITIKLDAKAVIAKLKSVTDNLPKDLWIIANQTAKQGLKKIADVVQEEITAPDKAIKPMITKKKKTTGYMLIVHPGKRLPLSAFRPKPRQTKTGVTYKVSKTAGSKSIPHAFLINGTGEPRIRGKDGEPRIQGKGGGINGTGEPQGKGGGPSGLVGRLPIFYLGLGPSPWGVLVTGNRIHKVVSFLEIKLRKNALERIRARIGDESGSFIT